MRSSMLLMMKNGDVPKLCFRTFGSKTTQCRIFNLKRRIRASRNCLKIPQWHNCGEGGIRTLGAFRHTVFPGLPFKPLTHLSSASVQMIARPAGNIHRWWTMVRGGKGYTEICCSALMRCSIGGCVANNVCHHEAPLPLNGVSSHMCAVESLADAIGVVSSSIFCNAEMSPSG
jgi:hypothetical protein